MELGSTMFISHLPKLDLHGYDRDSARVVINDFVKENIKLKNKEFVIVHGIGSGILKKTTHDTLKRNKNVREYAICYNNVGSTIVRVEIWQNGIFMVKLSHIKERKTFEFQRNFWILKVFYQNFKKMLTEQSFCGRIGNINF